MPGPLQPIIQKDFSRGENTVTQPYALRPDQVQQAVNFLLDEHGSLRVRDGTLVNGAAGPDANRPIVKLWDFVKVDGSVIRFAILAGINNLNNNSLYRRDSTPWTKIGDYGAYSLIPDALTFTNLTIFAISNTVGLSYNDGVVQGNLIGAPPGQHIANHLNYLWAWNTSNVSSASAGPSSLQSSDLNNPNSWPGANQTLISKDDGTQGQGLAQYTIAEAGISPTATLIAWKDFTGYECTNPFGSTFAVQKIKSDMGCIAPRTIQFISGFGVIRLTHRGFALYDGVNDTLISEEERPRIFGRDQYPGLDWTNIAHSQATQCANPPLYICACPTSGPALNLVFVYDLVRRAWTVLTFNNNFGTIQLILDANQLPMVLGGDWQGGRVRQLFNGAADDDGTAISWTARSRAFSGNSPSETMYWDRLLAKFYGFPSNTSVTATFYYGPTAVNQQKTVTKTIPSVTALSPFKGFGLDPFGTSAFGAVTPSVSDQDIAFAIGQLCNNVQVQLSGSGVGRIREMELQARSRSLTRSTYVGVR